VVSEQEQDIDYWRTLAQERQREIEALRERLVSLIDLVPDGALLSIMGAIDRAHAAWWRELDSLTPSADVVPSEILSVLDDLWRRVDAR
jgi:hypothetical protein